MLKVVTSDEIKDVEERAYRLDTTQEALMEKAGVGIAEETHSFIEKHRLKKKCALLCGKGNNGGDAFCAGVHLLQKGFDVIALEVHKSTPNSLAAKQKTRFSSAGGKVFSYNDESLSFAKEGCILDGIFGIGFHGTIDEPCQKIIQHVNNQKIPILAIDIPSGLDATTGKISPCAIHARATITMELPKIGFFIGNGWDVVGDIIALPIGLAPFAALLEPSLYLLEECDAAPLLPPIIRSRHKYVRGHVVGIAGTMSGAALMASWAALRAGAGIVHLLHEETYGEAFSGPPLEVVRVPYKKNDITSIVSWIHRADTFFVGPGLGIGDDASFLLEHLLKDCARKSVLDADALTWLSSRFTNALALPQAILTPHIGEMQRLLHSTTKEELSLEFLNTVRSFVEKYETNLVLKGGPTFLFSHGKTPMIMPRGDPGMATAGSGDVLTGILAALLAQKLAPIDAMCLGTWLHGLAGEYAAYSETSYSMTATSIISHLPQAFRHLELTK